MKSTLTTTAFDIRSTTHKLTKCDQLIRLLTTKEKKYLKLSLEASIKRIEEFKAKV